MSTSTGAEQGGHLVARFCSRLHSVLDSLAGVPAWSMSPGEQHAVLVDLARAEARVTELRLRVLAAADDCDIAADTAATSTAAWVAHATRQSRAAAHDDLRLARALEDRFATTRGALAAGLVDAGQARVVVRAVDRLPDSVTEHDREQAEKHLVQLAGEHDAKALQLLGRRVFEVIDPDAADHEEGTRLEAEERAAARATYLSLFDNGDGTHSGRFKISTLHAVMLVTMLNALTAPGRHHPPGSRPGSRLRTVTRPEMLGQAFTELLERLPSTSLPTAGGVAATVVVLLDYDKLVSGLGAAHLHTGQSVSATLARRLACQAGVIPAVYRRLLDGRSVVLDMGRKRRLHTEHQRIALAIQQHGCTAEACDRPPGWCHTHHDTAWSLGGATSLANGRLLCPFHHRRAHSPDYHVERLPTGKVRFHRTT